MNKITITFDGVEMSGTPDEIVRIAVKLGGADSVKHVTTDLYYSETKGWLKISEMSDFHLFNAFMKHYEDFLNDIREKVRTNQISRNQAIKMITLFPDSKNEKQVKVGQLATELLRR